MTRRWNIIAAGLIAWSFRPSPVEAGHCSFVECGTNSADIRGTSINGISLLGATNADGVSYVVGSLSLNPTHTTTPQICWSYSGFGYGLAVVDGAFVATTTRPGEIIPAECLVGATFELNVPVTSHTVTTPTRVKLLIAQRNWVSTWHAAVTPQVLPTYEVIDTGKNAPVCSTSDAWMEPWQVGGLPVDLSNPSGVVGMTWHAGTDHAVIVQGETYTKAAGIDATGSAWFNIACAGSALAKSRLMGYDPMTTTTTAGQRTGTLKMLTAHYVPNSNESWTQTGTPLIWVSNPSVAYYGSADPRLIGPIEAYWDANGATCISHMRLWNHTNAPSLGNEAFALADVRQKGGFGFCDTSRLGRAPGLVWTTTTVDHIAQ